MKRTCQHSCHSFPASSLFCFYLLAFGNDRACEGVSYRKLESKSVGSCKSGDVISSEALEINLTTHLGKFNF